MGSAEKANFEFLQAMELEDQDTGERSSLLDKVMGSVSNPKIARHELMVRMRGFEDMANEMGLVGMFYTLTAPSRYHSTHVQSGKRNDKYQHASPRKRKNTFAKSGRASEPNGVAKVSARLVFVLQNHTTMEPTLAPVAIPPP
jgi:hypothetical protein